MSRSPVILDGKAVAKGVLEKCANRVEKIKSQTGITPALATVLVGKDPASATYVKMKARRCESVGIKSIRVELPEPTDTDRLVAQITEALLTIGLWVSETSSVTVKRRNYLVASAETT